MAKELEKTQSVKPSKASKAAKAEKKPMTKKITKYLKDLKAEFKKVVWPTRTQVVHNTSVVLVTMAVAGVFIWGLDTIFSQLLKLVLGA